MVLNKYQEILPEKQFDELKDLQKVSECFINVITELKNSHDEVMQENKLLKEEYVQNDVEILRHLMETAELKEKVLPVPIQQHDDICKELELYRKLLGYSIVDLQGSDDNDITFVYREYCTLKFNINESFRFTLIEIKPVHPNFEAIKSYLEQTNDCAGLLNNIRKYFDIILDVNK